MGPAAPSKALYLLKSGEAVVEANLSEVVHLLRFVGR
jgi:hypothetical protein